MKRAFTGTLALILCFCHSGGGKATGQEGDTLYFRSNGGVFPAASGTLPEDLDSPEALLWRVPLDPGHSTPAIGNGRIFLTTFNPASAELATVALDFETGKTLWKKIAPVKNFEEYNTQSGSAAQATPAMDGERVIVFFGSYGLICFDHGGRVLWEHRIGPFQDEYGSASSPILLDGKVIVQQDHDVDSFLMALDAGSGRVLWKTPRPDASRSYSTPAVWNRNGRKELLVAGSLELAGYDPADGKKLWWTGGLARIVIPVPIPSGDRVYMSSWTSGGDGFRRMDLDAWPGALRQWDRNGDGTLSRFEIRDFNARSRFSEADLDQNGELEQKEWDRLASLFQKARNGTLASRPTAEGGALNESCVLWTQSRGAPYVATPLLDGGILWLVRDGGIVTQISPGTGDVLSERRLPGIGNYYASPVSVGGRVLFASEQGFVSVLENDRDWRVLETRNFGERIYATPQVAEGRLFIRTDRALYCFRKKD